MQQDNTKTSATTTKQDLHPSGLTWERWKQPFKMPHERKMIQEWLQRKNGSEFDSDTTNPF